MMQLRDKVNMICMGLVHSKMMIKKHSVGNT